MKQWRQCNLGDVLELKRGYDLPNADRRTGTVPIISSSGLSGWHDEAKVKAPGVVTGRYGTIGQVYFIKQNFWPLNTTLYVHDFKGNDERFVSYFLQSLDFQSFNDKSSVPGLNRNDLHRVSVCIPSVEEQGVIGKTLGSLDDKIEQNRKTCRALEALARATFKAWFVDFEPVKAKAAGQKSFPGMPAAAFAALPDRLTDSPLGPVPEGWKASTIGDLVEVCGGGTPSTKDERFWTNGSHFWATPKDLSSIEHPILLSTERRITDAGVAKISSGVLPEGTVLMSSRAPVGYLALAKVPTAINQGFIAIRCTGVLKQHYVLHWLLANMEEIKGRASGTTFAEISKSAFRPIPALVPSSVLVDSFENIVKPLFDLITHSVTESRKLSELRDYLLPRLLSGQVRVKPSKPTEVEAVTRLTMPVDPPKPTRQASDEFKEAVLIAALVRALAKPEYPLGRMRYNKVGYFVHRKAEHDVRQNFLKKAAGPYSPWAKYQGPEKIALARGYVKQAKVGKRSGFLPGDKIALIDTYLPRYGFASAIEWAVAKFCFRKNDDLELLATVDFAVLDLRDRKVHVDATSVHDLIASEPEWSPKLERAIFSNDKIADALRELQDMFPNEYDV